MYIIKIVDVEKEYKLGKTTINALNGISLTLKNNQFYSIIGPSGSGKSTLAHIIGGIDTPSAGKVFFKEQDVSKFTNRKLTELRASSIGFVFQHFYLNPVLTALDNVALGLRINKVSKIIARTEALKSLEEVGLRERIGHYPNELSGGERQRVAIARALVKKPVIIIADEPTGNLDSKTAKKIMTLFKEIQEKEKTTIIQVTHNLELAKIADELIQINDGIRIG